MGKQGDLQGEEGELGEVRAGGTARGGDDVRGAEQLRDPRLRPLLVYTRYGAGAADEGSDAAPYGLPLPGSGEAAGEELDSPAAV